MNWLEQMQALIGVLVLVVVVLLFTRRAFGRARGKRATTTSNVLEVMEEVFSPARHAAALELRSQQEKASVTPAPDDGLPPAHDGLYVVKRKDPPAPTDQPRRTRDSSAPEDLDTSGTGA